MSGIAARLEREYPDSNRDQSALVGPLSAQIVGDIRPMLLLLLSGAGLLLAIACVNVVSLLLVRSEGRKRELAVRSTLGASNGRLIRQFVTEAFVLVALGVRRRPPGGCRRHPAVVRPHVRGHARADAVSRRASA